MTDGQINGFARNTRFFLFQQYFVNDRLFPKLCSCQLVSAISSAGTLNDNARLVCKMPRLRFSPFQHIDESAMHSKEFATDAHTFKIVFAVIAFQILCSFTGASWWHQSFIILTYAVALWAEFQTDKCIRMLLLLGNLIYSICFFTILAKSSVRFTCSVHVNSAMGELALVRENFNEIIKILFPSVVLG